MFKVDEGTVTAVVLGMMQDAGLPHIGCRCQHCRGGQVAWAACLGVVDARGERPLVWLIDATPDIKYQINYLAEALGPHATRPQRLRQPDGLFFDTCSYGAY